MLSLVMIWVFELLLFPLVGICFALKRNCEHILFGTSPRIERCCLLRFLKDEVDRGFENFLACHVQSLPEIFESTYTVHFERSSTDF